MNAPLLELAKETERIQSKTVNGIKISILNLFTNSFMIFISSQLCNIKNIIIREIGK